MKQKKSHKKLIIVLVIIAVIIIAAIIGGKKFLDSKLGGGGNEEGYTDYSYETQLERVTVQDLSETISLQGTVSGESKTEYSSTAEARIKELNVQVGDTVKVGDVIATLDSADIQEQIDSINKTLSNAQALQNYTNSQNNKDLQEAKDDQVAALTVAQANINAAVDVYNSIKAKIEAAPSNNEKINAKIEKKQAKLDALDTKAEDYETKKAALEAEIAELKAGLYDVAALSAELASADADIQAANADYNATKAQTDQAIESAQSVIDMQKFETNDDSATKKTLAALNDQLNDCTIVATADGIVTSVLAQVGDMNTAKQPIVTVENNAKMIMSASVDESDILRLEEGMKAVITASALGDVEIGGVVTKVVRIMSADSSTGVSGFSVQITLDDSELLSGMSARAKVLVTDKPSVLCVPYDLVQYDEDGNQFVLVAEQIGDGKFKAVKKTVEIGEEANYYAEVLGGEVVDGDYIIMDYGMMEGDEFNATIWDDYSYEEEAIEE